MSGLTTPRFGSATSRPSIEGENSQSIFRLPSANSQGSPSSFSGFTTSISSSTSSRARNVGSASPIGSFARGTEGLPTTPDTQRVAGSPSPSTPSVGSRDNSPSGARASRLTSGTQGGNGRASNVGNIAGRVGSMSLSPVGAGHDLRTPASRRRSGTPVPPTRFYQVEDEHPPQARFYEPAFQQAFTNARRLVTDLRIVLASAHLHREPGSDIERLHREASELSNFVCSARRIVGFVGDSGAGKSSLINSLLDIPDFARSGNSGAACTCVAVEFHYHDRPDFVVEVEYFTVDEIDEQHAELLDFYRTYHSDDNERDDTDEARDLREKAKLAEDTFKSTFPAFPRAVLQSLHSLPRDAALAILSAATRTSYHRVTGGVNISHKREVLANAADCSRYLVQLTSNRSSARRSGNGPAEVQSPDWPFIRRIKVFVRAVILSRGLVLVDLPGLRDNNSARVIIAERAVKDCHEIFAVCEIGRAATNRGVDDIFRLASRAELANVSIVCTKSDDIRPHEAIRDFPEHAAEMKRLMGTVEHTQDDLEAFRGIVEEFGDDIHQLAPDELEEYRRAFQDQRNAERSLKDAEFALKQYLIETRARSVEPRLQEKHLRSNRNRQVNVFCVSNTMYRDYRTKPLNVAQRFLDLSKIINLRIHCISLVAASQLAAATVYITDRIPALLGSISTWVQSGAGDLSTAERVALRATVDRVELGLEQQLLAPTAVRNSTSRLEVELQERFIRPMTAFRVQWAQAAAQASVEWQGWNPSTYSAFCRNYGEHRTEGVGRHCWNDTAIAAMVAWKGNGWDELINIVSTTGHAFCNLVTGRFAQATEALSRPLARPNLSVQTLEGTLIHRNRLLGVEIQGVWERFEDELRVLGSDAFTGVRTSHMGVSMEASYRECNLDGGRLAPPFNKQVRLTTGPGRGSDGRRKTRIRNRLGEPQLFVDLQRKLRDRFRELTLNLEEKVQEVMREHLETVFASLDMLRNDNPLTEGEQYPEFRQRLETELNRVSEELQHIQRIVEPFVVV